MKSPLLRAVILFTGLCIYALVVYAFGKSVNSGTSDAQVESVSLR